MAHRWSAGLGDQAKRAFRTALTGLREIPELAELQAGDDAGQFEGNFDYVAVLDFADFAAARRYAEHRSTGHSSSTAVTTLLEPVI